MEVYGEKILVKMTKAKIHKRGRVIEVEEIRSKDGLKSQRRKK